MRDGPVWYCTRQRAGPLVKECRYQRPRLPDGYDADEKRRKRALLKSSVCKSNVDRTEFWLALFGWDGVHYTLTFDDASLPDSFEGVRRELRNFFERCKRFRGVKSIDYLYCIEGRHGEHRYHVHLVLRDSDFPPAVVQHLWRRGWVDDEPVLLKKGGFRRLARYFNKESSDGLMIPVGRHCVSHSRGLAARMPAPERWNDSSGEISIPEGVFWSQGPEGANNEFGAYCYGSWIEKRRTRNG